MGEVKSENQDRKHASYDKIKLFCRCMKVHASVNQALPSDDDDFGEEEEEEEVAESAGSTAKEALSNDGQEGLRRTQASNSLDLYTL